MKPKSDCLVVVHDCVYDHTGVSFSDHSICKVIQSLPLEIVKEGDYWGYHDTVVSDMIYTWIGSNLDTLKRIVD
ncbi:hypothetical protein [Shouchella clausii]|uniref:hypothetical protein n=1 Tax=Shouchella clausii TaxID=79880 RepID=UPI001C72A298|nr:hypothetical protein [Shouchella clausii]MBX0320123.1 hypothetical protein [Shouchella clausii]